VENKPDISLAKFALFSVQFFWLYFVLLNSAKVAYFCDIVCNADIAAKVAADIGELCALRCEMVFITLLMNGAYVR
jgi:hypothetical protein